jgi:hypothetical protein
MSKRCKTFLRNMSEQGLNINRETVWLILTKYSDLKSVSMKLRPKDLILSTLRYGVGGKKIYRCRETLRFLARPSSV